MKCTRIEALCLLAVFAGNAHAQPAGNLARIYVYAQSSTAARSWLPISCDSTVVANLKRGTFFAVEAAPGRHVIDLSAGNGVPVSVETHPDEQVFVRLDWHIERDNPAIPVLQIVQPDLARIEMLPLRYVDTGKVLSKSVAKTDPRGPPQLKKRGIGE
jgi:hypothetical protein